MSKSFMIFLVLLVAVKSEDDNLCSDFYAGKRPEPELQYSCVEAKICADGRQYGFFKPPQRASKVLIDLINKAQNAKCPVDGNICCGDKFLYSEELTNHIKINDLLFKQPERDYEKVKSAGFYNTISLLNMLMSLFYAYIF